MAKPTEIVFSWSVITGWDSARVAIRTRNRKFVKLKVIGCVSVIYTKAAAPHPITMYLKCLSVNLTKFMNDLS